jgi:hypothetical protein
MQERFECFYNSLLRSPVIMSAYFVWLTGLNQSVAIQVSGVTRPRGDPKFATPRWIRSLQRDIAVQALEKGRSERSLTAAKEECNSLQATNALLSPENTLRRQQIQKFG